MRYTNEATKRTGFSNGITKLTNCIPGNNTRTHTNDILCIIIYPLPENTHYILIYYYI